MDSLFKLPRVTQASNIKCVLNVYDQIETNVRIWQAPGIKSEMYGSLLIPIMMEKIPEEFRLVISPKTTSDTWDINELLEAFKEELEAREKGSLWKDPVMLWKSSCPDKTIHQSQLQQLHCIWGSMSKWLVFFATTQVVQFCVIRLGGGGLNLYVEGYCVPSICAPLSQLKTDFAKSS